MAESREGQIVAALVEARGCGCCSSYETAQAVLPDACEADEDGYVDHSYDDDCVATFRHLVGVAVRALKAETLREFADLTLGPSKDLRDAATCRSIALDAQERADELEDE
jgi:hypothetical protein